MSATEKALAAAEVEVAAKASRRRFTMEYKRKILHEADACKTPGAVGALLRREGLYSSHLTTWRAARDRGERAGAPKKRGPIPQGPDPRDPERFPAGPPHPPVSPMEVWINPPKIFAPQTSSPTPPTPLAQTVSFA